jgi:hypothetical protein
MRQWTILIGKRKIELLDNEGTADAVEICTRALEYLHEKEIDYAVGPLIEAQCEGNRSYERSDIILANAGKYYESAELQKMIKKAKPVKK